LVLLGLAPVLLAGCLAGYVYPKISYVPGLEVAAPPQDVRAFVVHVQRESALSFSACPHLTLKPLPQSNHLGAQAELSFERGYWLWGGIRISEHVSHDLSVRLYRQSYRTVEVPSWRRFAGVHWNKVESLADREQAVDDLLGPWPIYDGPIVNGESAAPTFDHLQAGSTDAEHRQALLFAVAEYEALSQAPGVDSAARRQLLLKARDVRNRAEQ
jgi:hypothetical protein